MNMKGLDGCDGELVVDGDAQTLTSSPNDDCRVVPLDAITLQALVNLQQHTLVAAPNPEALVPPSAPSLDLLAWSNRSEHTEACLPRAMTIRSVETRALVRELLTRRSVRAGLFVGLVGLISAAGLTYYAGYDQGYEAAKHDDFQRTIEGLSHSR